MSPVDRTDIEHFVRQGLGCRCPDDAFRSIRIEPDAVPAGPLVATRLVIGDRLLIYVLDDSTGRATAQAVRDLARQGVDERNRRGLNRFRLVLASTQPALLREGAVASFAGVADDDDRAHLHVIAAEQLPLALRSC